MKAAELVLRFSIAAIAVLCAALFFDNDVPFVESAFWSEFWSFICLLSVFGALLEGDKVILREAREWKYLLLKWKKTLTTERTVVAFFALALAIGFGDRRVGLVQSIFWSTAWAILFIVATICILFKADEWLRRFLVGWRGFLSPAKNYQVGK